MNNKYKFRYGRYLFAGVVTFIAMLPVLFFIIILWGTLIIPIQTHYIMAAIVFVILLLFVNTIALYFTEGIGFGILHEDFVEIRLGRRKIEIDYNHIERISLPIVHWHVRVEGGESRIAIGMPLPRRTDKLEKFMTDLKAKIAQRDVNLKK